MPINEIEWQIAKGKIVDNLRNVELAKQLGITHENNISRIYVRFIKKIEQMEEDLCRAIEMGLYEPKIITSNLLNRRNIDKDRYLSSTKEDLDNKDEKTFKSTVEVQLPKKCKKLPIDQY